MMIDSAITCFNENLFLFDVKFSRWYIFFLRKAHASFIRLWFRAFFVIALHLFSSILNKHLTTRVFIFAVYLFTWPGCSAFENKIKSTILSQCTECTNDNLYCIFFFAGKHNGVSHERLTYVLFENITIHTGILSKNWQRTETTKKYLCLSIF